MKKNILKTLTNNIGFKILAVFFAFTLWLLVYNLDDPTKTKTLTVNVDIENRENLDNMGKYYEILNGSNKVSFSVTAARSILDKLDDTDFTATANFDQLVIEGNGSKGTVPIEIQCTANVNKNAIKLRSTNKSLKLRLEDLMIKQFVVSAKATGQVAEGYALGSIQVTAPNVLKVSGPKSIVQTISTAVAIIDVSGMSEAWTSYRPTPVLYDKDGKEVDTTRLTLSSSTVNVSAEILNTKEVTIAVDSIGTPAEGYMVTSIKTNPTSILLKGNKALLNTINTIEIPEELVSVEGKSEDVKVTVDVSEYIPTDVFMVDPEGASVEITVKIGKIKEKVFSVDTDDIVVTGLSTQSKLEFAVTSVAIHVSGLETDIAELSNESISASIDVTDLVIGTHEIELLLDLDESKYSCLPVKVTVYITDAVIPDVDEPEEE